MNFSGCWFIPQRFILIDELILVIDSYHHNDWLIVIPAGSDFVHQLDSQCQAVIKVKTCQILLSPINRRDLSHSLVPNKLKLNLKLKCSILGHSWEPDSWKWSRHSFASSRNNGKGEKMVSSRLGTWHVTVLLPFENSYFVLLCCTFMIKQHLRYLFW